MSRRDDHTSLTQMLQFARKAVSLTAPLSEDEFLQHELHQYAIWKLVEIVGEAAARVSAPKRGTLSGIPWEAVIGMRNHLAHGYDLIDLPTLWDTVSNDLPPLIVALEAALAPEEG